MPEIIKRQSITITAGVGVLQSFPVLFSGLREQLTLNMQTKDGSLI